jgi:DNA-directed RNA polymerase subunit RPC12/RpoP
MKRATWQLIIVISLMALSAPSARPARKAGWSTEGGAAASALGQGTEPELVLSLHRDFGYGGFGEIQGNFRLTASGPQDLTRVVFWMDDQVLGEVTAAPWQVRFHTDSFAPGSHAMSALGYTAAGQELHSNEIRTRFLSSQEAGHATTRLIVVSLGGILVLMALSALLSSVLFRRRGHALPPGTPRNYGLAGGAVCSRCGRPFARNLFAPNLMAGKVQRCPYCGKWGIVRAASRAELAAAEAAELEGITTPEQVPAESGPDQLRRDVEDSRFQDQ